ncbi:MAG TPA: hypothetical protein VGD02_06805 [Gemmatimonadaceae bacterium]
MEDSLVDHFPVLKVLYDNALKQGGRYGVVPDSFRVDDDDGTVAADTETGRLAAFHTARPEEKVFAVEQGSEQRIDLSPAAIR